MMKERLASAPLLGGVRGGFLKYSLNKAIYDTLMQEALVKKNKEPRTHPRPLPRGEKERLYKSIKCIFKINPIITCSTLPKFV
jgi:hypothetical protein